MIPVMRQWFLLSMTWLNIMFFSVGASIPGAITDEEFIPAAVPTDLAATAAVYNASKGLLQLNISWSPNKDGPHALSYNIHVMSLNESDSHCDTEQYYAFVEDPSSRSWVASPEPMPNALHETNALSVLPECSYRIRLEANPHDGKTYAEMDYRVPDCVEDVCSCRLSASLPKPELQLEHITNESVKLTWSVQDQQNVSFFILRVGPKLLESIHGSMYNLSWSQQVPATSQELYHEIYTAQVEGTYAAAVRVVDFRRCQGPEEQLVFDIGSTDSQVTFTTTQMFLIISIPGVSFLLIVCAIVVALGPKCYSWYEDNKQNTQLGGRRFLYKAIRIRGERVFRRNKTLQEWNVLYVEKEIEDAKMRGEVDNFEISSNRLTFQKEIGRGAFGQVFLAKAEAIRGIPGSRLVAVKKLKTTAGLEEKEEFLEEISMLKRVGQHPNVISLLACCTLQSELCMVMEFVPCGDLLKYLRSLRQQLDSRKPSVTSDDAQYSTPSTVMTSFSSRRCSTIRQERNSQLENALDHRELHNFALQIAKGMAHLEAKKITHRDLAARNILIDDNKTLKISDFGLSRRGVYVNTRRRKVPLRWLSIEAMKDSLYSSRSDVWAFAIVLWEIGTLGGFPYPTVFDFDLLDYLKTGSRLEKPDIVSNNLYSVMLACWSDIPDDRPSFSELVSYLEPSQNHHVYVDISGHPCLPPTSPHPSMGEVSSIVSK